MKYKRFEELPVWNDSISYAVSVLNFTTGSSRLFAGTGDLKSQIERASISVSNNIAEGFERGSNAELIQFLYIARASCGECRSITHILGRLSNFRGTQEQVLKLRSEAEAISKQLYRWIESLKRSGYKGEKFLTEEEKLREERKREAIEFRKELKEIMAKRKK